MLLLKEIINSFKTGPGFTGQVLRRIRRESGGGKADIRGPVLRFIRSVADRPQDLDQPGNLSLEDLRELAKYHDLDLADPEVVHEILNFSRTSPEKILLSDRELKAVAGGRTRPGDLDRASEAVIRMLEELQKGK